MKTATYGERISAEVRFEVENLAALRKPTVRAAMTKITASIKTFFRGKKFDIRKIESQTAQIRANSANFNFRYNDFR